MDGWFCMNDGTLLIASNLAACADCAALMKPPGCCCWLLNKPPLGACDCAFPNNPLVCPEGLNEPVLNIPLDPPVGPLNNEALLPGKTLPVWLLKDAFKKLPFKLFPGKILFWRTWLFPGVILDSDYSHIDESRFEYCEVLWTGDRKEFGLIVGGCLWGEFDVSGVDEIVDLNTLASSFLLLMISCNNVTLGVLTGAKNGLCFAP